MPNAADGVKSAFDDRRDARLRAAQDDRRSLLLAVFVTGTACCGDDGGEESDWKQTTSQLTARIGI